MSSLSPRGSHVTWVNQWFQLPFCSMRWSLKRIIRSSMTPFLTSSQISIQTMHSSSLTEQWPLQMQFQLAFLLSHNYFAGITLKVTSRDGSRGIPFQCIKSRNRLALSSKSSIIRRMEYLKRSASYEMQWRNGVQQLPYTFSHTCSKTSMSSLPDLLLKDLGATTPIQASQTMHLKAWTRWWRHSFNGRKLHWIPSSWH